MGQTAEERIFGGSTRRGGDKRWEQKVATSYCRLRGGKGLGKWWEKKGRWGVGVDATCPRCGKEDDTPDHIVFRCSKIKGVKDEKGRGRREWGFDGIAEKR